MNYQTLAEEAVKNTYDEIHGPDTAYRGEHPLGTTWAITFAQNRDSEVLDRTNFEVISADLRKRFPTSVDTERFDHWAVGWVDYLVVRMLDRKGKVTKAGAAALEWKEKLEDYPVADEEAVSRAEYDQTMEDLQNVYDMSEELAGRVYSLMHYPNPDWSEKDVIQAVQAARLEGLLQEGWPKDLAAKALAWIENWGGWNDTLIRAWDDYYEQQVQPLRTVFHLSFRDVVKVLEAADDVEADLTDPAVVADLIQRLRLRPEDVETLPLPFGYLPGSLEVLRRRRGKL